MRLTSLSSIAVPTPFLPYLSGTAFGEAGQGYLRFSYANSVENITEGLRRIREALKRYQAPVG